MENESGSRAWVAVSTHPFQETAAVANLERQKFEVYCPLLRKRVCHARKFRDVLRPMFPGYLFVDIDTGTSGWRPINSTVGVRNVVRCGDKLGVLNPSFVASLRAREIDGAVTRPECSFQIGQQIKIAGGPFDGLIATITALNDQDRLTVLMDLLNGRVKVQIKALSSVAV